MKKLLLFVALFITMPVAAGQLPDNMYFRAMQDEMKRTGTAHQRKGRTKALLCGL